MKQDSWRAQLWWIAAAYAVAFAISAFLLVARYIQETENRAEAMAASGMYGFGDLILYIFVAFLFMIPTGFLVWSVAKFEAAATRYSQGLLVFSVSAPVCLTFLALGEHRLGQNLFSLLVARLMWAPFIVVGMGVSRWRLDSPEQRGSHRMRCSSKD